MKAFIPLALLVFAQASAFGSDNPSTAESGDSLQKAAGASIGAAGVAIGATGSEGKNIREKKAEKFRLTQVRDDMIHEKKALENARMVFIESHPDVVKTGRPYREAKAIDDANRSALQAERDAKLEAWRKSGKQIEAVKAAYKQVNGIDPFNLPAEGQAKVPGLREAIYAQEKALKAYDLAETNFQNYASHPSFAKLHGNYEDALGHAERQWEKGEKSMFVEARRLTLMNDISKVNATLNTNEADLTVNRMLRGIRLSVAGMMTAAGAYLLYSSSDKGGALIESRGFPEKREPPARGEQENSGTELVAPGN